MGGRCCGINSGGPRGGAQVLELLAYFTYCTPAITPRLWSLWEPMALCLNEWAVDFFESVLVAVDNFISRATDTFLTCKQPDYLASANHVRPPFSPLSSSDFPSSRRTHADSSWTANCCELRMITHIP